MLRKVEEPLPGTTIDPTCPDSDDIQMGETDFHALAVIWLREALEDYFAERSDVYVASNLFLYYEKGRYRYHRDPDVMVVMGVGKHQRRSFRTWEEKTVPRVVFEIASERTWSRDLYDKPEVYAGIGIPEYFLFDAEGVYLDPILRGFHRTGGRKYARMRLSRDGSLTSRELGLRLVPEGGMLRLLDVQTGTRILTRSERAEEDHRRAEELAAEVERLRKQLRKQHGTTNGGNA